MVGQDEAWSFSGNAGLSVPWRPQLDARASPLSRPDGAPGRTSCPRAGDRAISARLSWNGADMPVDGEGRHPGACFVTGTSVDLAKVRASAAKSCAARAAAAELSWRIKRQPSRFARISAAVR